MNISSSSGSGLRIFPSQGKNKRIRDHYSVDVNDLNLTNKMKGQIIDKYQMGGGGGGIKKNVFQ